jgi:TolB-like protein/Tfp pilus assembly protein PilF
VSGSSLQRFLAELKRRKVFQVAAVYGAGVFAVLQGVDVLVPALGLPESLVTIVAIAGFVGFPLVLLVAWIYERTPQGLIRTADASPGEITRIIEAPAAKRWPVGLAAAAGTALLLVGGWLALGRPAASSGGQGASGERAGPPAGMTAAGTAQAAGDRADETPSIAVLPFADLSEEGDKEYFADGLAEELIDALVRVEGLRVAARTSSFAFKGGNADVRTIADSLGVQTVLEGSVRASGDKLRITAQLIQASDGFHLWSGSYDRQLTDVFEVQEEIAGAISEALLGSLGIGAVSDLSVARTDIEAYEQYLLGRAFVSQRGDALRRAEEHFRAAIAIDSLYAPAWGGLAEVYAHYPYYFEVDVEESLATAEDAARRALAIDSTSASARVALGSVLRDRHEWDAAERELKRALELAPESSEAHGEYGQYLLEIGRLDEGVEESNRALALDPLSGQKLGVAGMYELAAGREEDGLEKLWRARNFPVATAVLAQHLAYRGRLDEAAEAARLDATAADELSLLVEALRSPEGSELRSRGLEFASTPGSLESRMGGDTGQPAWLILFGEPDGALDLLETTVGDHPIGFELLWLPVYDPIRDDPRFQAVVHAIGQRD